MVWTKLILLGGFFILSTWFLDFLAFLGGVVVVGVDGELDGSGDSDDSGDSNDSNDSDDSDDSTIEEGSETSSGVVDNSKELVVFVSSNDSDDSPDVFATCVPVLRVSPCVVISLLKGVKS